MFQSIKYLNCAYDNETKLYHYNYEITDSNFISTSAVTTAAPAASAAWVSATATAAIQEYENRNYKYKEIVSNLFLLNMFLKDNWGYKDLNKILERQHKYLIKENFPETNFNEKYYDGLVKYTKKVMVIY